MSTKSENIVKVLIIFMQILFTFKLYDNMIAYTREVNKRKFNGGRNKCWKNL